MIPKQNIYKKGKKVFSVINAGILWNIAHIFNKNKINKLHLSSNEASCHHICVNDTHREKAVFYSIQY